MIVMSQLGYIPVLYLLCCLLMHSMRIIAPLATYQRITMQVPGENPAQDLSCGAGIKLRVQREAKLLSDKTRYTYAIKASNLAALSTYFSGQYKSSLLGWHLIAPCWIIDDRVDSTFIYGWTYYADKLLGLPSCI